MALVERLKILRLTQNYLCYYGAGKHQISNLVLEQNNP